MKKQDLLALRTFFSENLLKQKLSKQKKAEIELYISILDQSLQKKDPFQFLIVFLSAVKVEEIVKVIFEYFKSD